ncbi:MAG: periplasmic heavy metal sensor [Verrucomicrobiota bacterium]
MRRGLTIFCCGLAAAGLAYAAIYFCATARLRAAGHADAPELLWLKEEFKLGDAEYKRISELHAGYLPRCQEMCGRIAAKNEELAGLLAKTNTVTPEIERKLAEAAALRAECQKNMLEHFYTVSRAMPPEEGRRYLEWIQEQTMGGGGHASGGAGHEMHEMQ